MKKTKNEYLRTKNQKQKTKNRKEKYFRFKY